jgi:ribosomal protein S3AE
MAAKKLTEIKIPLLDMSINVAGALEGLDGRGIKIDLTRMLKGKSMEATFILDAKEQKANPKKLVLLPFYILRVMRKGTSYVEDSFSCKSKTAMLRIKPFLITRKKVSRSIRKALREKAREFIKSFCEDKTIEEIFSDVLSARLQKELALKLKKIYPLAVCEIRVVEKEKQ